MIKIKVVLVGLQRQIDSSKIEIHVNFSFIWCQMGLEANVTHISPLNTFASLAQNSYTTEALIS